MFSTAIRACSVSYTKKCPSVIRTHQAVTAIISRKYQSTDSKEFNSKTASNGQWEQIYSGMLESRIRQLKVVSFMTSGAGLFIQPLLLQKAAELNTSLAATIGVCTIAGFFTFVTPMLIHLVTRKYVTRMDYDKTNDQYLATTISFFLQPKKILFKTHEVRLPMSQKLTVTFYTKNTPLFVDPHAFTDVMHYQRILGYDKPYELESEFQDVVTKPVVKSADVINEEPFAIDDKKDVIKKKLANKA
ncbi:transmembrane protein 70 homolog, mitochondrial [Adelges cooleyi]|uniref:transmembrane protein 70 homolog, mitochondrial n=1 Tax=Adelges cooleyi TaxID=133065 RepID=UPI0021800BFF|nr:transmembrane protein 70 homolog, mitochondrial [Adelges cooleyi]